MIQEIHEYSESNGFPRNTGYIGHFKDMSEYMNPVDTFFYRMDEINC